MKEKLKNIIKSKTFRTIFLVTLAFLSLSVFCLKLDIVKNSSLESTSKIARILEKLAKSLKGYNVAYIPMFIAFYHLYSKWYFDGKKINKVAVVLATFFAITMVFGYSYKVSNSLGLVFKGTIQILKSVIVGFGYYTMFYILIKKFYEWLDSYKVKNENKKENKILNFIFEKHAFIMPFVIIFLMWLPYMVFLYPGTSPKGDTRAQIYQFYHIDNYTTDTVNLISQDVYINNHHPVFHTLIVNAFIKIGELLGDYNIGAFLYTIVQVIILDSFLSYLFVWMKKRKFPMWIRVIALITFTLLSFIPTFAVNLGKETYSTILTMLFVVMLFEMTENMEKIKSKKFCTVLILSMLGTMLFRNDGIYRIVIPFIIFIFFHKKYWKKLLLLLLIPVIIYEAYLNVILPACKIQKGSIKEMLSVPFQQTARVVAKHGENAYSEEEKEVINKILQYDTMKEDYDPSLADPIKNKFKKESTKEDLKDYFKVWFKNFFKYPVDYIQATLNNTYGYFYTDLTKSIGYMEINFLDDGIFNIKNLECFESGREDIKQYHGVVKKLPVISMAYSVGFHVDILLIAIGYMLSKRKYKWAVPFLPLVILILICLVSPVNAHWRYTLPIIMFTPITIGILVNLSNREEKD